MRAAVFASLGLLVLPAAALAGGCSSDSPAAPADAGTDADAGKPSPPPLAPLTDPVPFDVPTWTTTFLSASATSDPVRLELEQGTFTLPPVGPRADGTWKVSTPNANGSFGKFNSGLLYAAASLDVPAGQHLFARPDSVVSVWTDNALVQPGDVYGAGKTRVPVVPKDGTHLVVVRGSGGRGEIQVQLWSTPDELVFNLADVTSPDLVEGATSTQWLGVPILNVTDGTAFDLKAKVEDSDQFTATTVVYPALPGGAVTQLAIQLVPKVPVAAAGTKLTVGVRLESDSLEFSYRRDVELTTVAKGSTYKQTFRSDMDGSAQYYGVVPPTGFDPQKKYALALSLHGASVEAIGQAKSYSQKDWAFVVAATNRRPFGFDWESFGRRDAIEVLDQAMATFPIDPTHVYLTGHSMGGHGTWNFGVLFPGRFATLGPSAGWGSYYTYAGLTPPTGAFARSQAPSDTFAYMSNLAKRGVYMIHGTADDNVPFSEGQAMYTAVTAVTTDVDYHWEQGAGHWWDGPASPGVDCVDWPALFDFMKAHTLDPNELDFKFTTPGPWVSPKHSYVTVRSQTTPWKDSVLTSARATDTVTLTTDNVRSLQLDGAALDAAGIAKVVVDGAPYSVTKGAMAVGPQDGKHPLVHGPINEVFYRPFCFAYADGAPAAYAHWAAYVTSSWQVIGNGQACAVPLSKVTAELRSSRNIVYLGVPSAQIPAAAGLPVTWDDKALVVGGASHTAGVLAVVFPEGDRLSGAIMALPGSEGLLTRFQPLRPVASPPDFILWDALGTADSGFFDPTWKTIAPP